MQLPPVGSYSSVKKPQQSAAPKRTGTYSSDGVSVALKESPAKKAKTENSKRLKSSNFLLTINPNKKYELDTEEIQTAVANLQKAGEEFLEEKVFSQAVRFLVSGDSWDKPGIIQSSHTKAVIERGDIEKRVHLHVTISIEHYSMVQINTAWVKEWFSKKLGMPMYVNIKFFPDQKSAAEKLDMYIEKNQAVEIGNE